MILVGIAKKLRFLGRLAMMNLSKSMKLSKKSNKIKENRYV